MSEALAEGIMYENLKADYAKTVVVFPMFVIAFRCYKFYRLSNVIC